MKRAVMFGAGNIGRGFIGQLLVESGYHVAFVDIDRELIDLFNADGAYNLEVVFNNDVTRRRIGPVSGIDVSENAAAAVHAVAQAEVAATAVGVRALPQVVRTIAAGIEQRATTGAPPLNIIICENLKNAAAIVRGMIEAAIADSARGYLADSVGLVDTVIGRMVPPPTPEMRAADPGLIRVEPYKELPVDRNGFRGSVPTIASLAAHDDFPRFTARKLYIHNCGHAVLCYAGYLAGYEFGWQALADDRIRTHLYAAWSESAAGIVQRYGAEPDWLQAHMDDLYGRFQNRALGDTIFRLGRDPVRKLGPTDRLVAPARLAEEAGRSPTALAAAIAQAMHFDAPADPVAAELSARLAAEGPAAVLQDVCRIRADEPLGKAILRHFAVAPEKWRRHAVPRA